MKRYLTTRQKERHKPYLLNKQDCKCLFCKQPLTPQPPNDIMSTTYEHLDGDVFHNDLSNLALAHKRCNNDKKYNSDYQIIARAQLKDNSLTVDSMSVGGVPAREPKATSKEIDINVAMWEIVQSFIDSRLLNKNQTALELNATAHSISYLMKKQTGHGSDQTAKRHIMDYCSDVAPYKLEEEGGKWYIYKR